eukprot:comp23772_c0_seq1/m.41199 comp23772_c0_seq1/g.41199  ORF comp23772_c0_seq1/g.41199 comp23772_c0_seq1/m.41199 type:complete len:1254 (-) comp23772_c0_seq1:650-4411(-)
MQKSIQAAMQPPKLWQKSLNDLIRGLRANKGNEAQFLAESVAEIREELKSDSATSKATAVSKLTYLHMLGYDVSFGAFKIVEVMSQAKYSHKRVGYLAASQIFHDDTDVLMLTTNMLKKDILSQNQFEAGLALNGLANFVTPDLARDLANDLLTVLSSTRPYVRKKALLAMYKVLLRFPDALRPFFPRLRDKLDDPELSVQSAAVNVICELARKNPKNYLSLAPNLFRMLGSHNNWMLIKIIKLFAALLPHEPRLAKKLLEPLTNIINTTPAMSLLYETISTVIEGMPGHAPSVQLCVSKLRLFIEDSDQNLKYLGLVQLAKISKIQPKAATEHKDLVLACLDDADETIRVRALELLSGMASKKSVPDIVKRLMATLDKMASLVYRDEIIKQMINMCSQENFKHIANFEWYFGILVSLVRIENTTQGPMVASQLLEVAIRVKNVRPYAVQKMADLLIAAKSPSRAPSPGMMDVLYAAAYICGEFCEHLPNAKEVLSCMVHPEAASLPPNVQAGYMHNVLKIYAHMLKSEQGDVDGVLSLLRDGITTFTESTDLEVQERACMVRQILHLLVELQAAGTNLAPELAVLFEGEQNPVAPKAQKKVPVPDGLKLDKWIYDPPSSSEDEEERVPEPYSMGQTSPPRRKEYVEDPADVERRREERRRQLASNPHYLAGGELRGKKSDLDVDSIPVQRLELDRVIDLGLNEESKSRKSRKHRHRIDEGPSVPEQHYEVAAVEDLPDGAVPSPQASEEEEETDDPHKKLNIDLDAPLNEKDILPVRQHRTAKAPEPEKKKDRDRRDKDKDRRSRDSSKRHSSSSHSGRRESKDSSERRERDRDTDRHREKDKERDRGKEKEREKEKGREREKDREREKREKERSKDRTSDSRRSDEKDRRSKDDDKRKEKTTSGREKDIERRRERDGEKDRERSKEKEREKERGERCREKDSRRRSKDDGRKGSSEGKETESRVEETIFEVDQKTSILDLPPPGVEEGDLDGWLGQGPAGASPQAAPGDETPEDVPAAAYRPLAENDAVSLGFEVRFGTDGHSTYICTLVSNKTPSPITQLAFTLQSHQHVTVEGATDCEGGWQVSIPGEVASDGAAEAQIELKIDSVIDPIALEGSLTYHETVNPDESPVPTTLPFTLHLPVSVFVVPVPVDPQTFSGLLSGGTLCGVQKRTITAQDGYDELIHLLETCMHMVVVERVGKATSTYGRTVQDQHICLLVRALEGEQVSLECKASSEQLATNILDEISSALA